MTPANVRQTDQRPATSDQRQNHDSILLVGFGGPECLEDVEPFLKNVAGGRSIPRERLDAVREHYRRVGGKSPYNELTFRQAEGLTKLLRKEGCTLPVYVGMRNWRPTLADTLAEMAREGRKRAIGFVLAPHRSEASWDRYLAAIQKARDEVGPEAPAVDYCPPWHTHPLFIEALVDRIKETLDTEKNPGRHCEPRGSGAPAKGRSASGGKQSPHLIYTAHSIPVAMARKCRYEEEIRETVEAVNTKLAVTNYSIAYQSRSGQPSEPWLGPDVKDAIATRHEKRFLVVPIGFLVDHMEVVYELDIDLKVRCEERGIKLTRAATVGDHPGFLKLMLRLTQEKIPITLPG